MSINKRFILSTSEYYLSSLTRKGDLGSIWSVTESWTVDSPFLEAVKIQMDKVQDNLF